MFKKFNFTIPPHRKKRLIIIWSVVAVLLIFLYFSLIRPVTLVYGRTSTLKTTAKEAFTAAKTQDLPGLEKSIKQLKKDVVVARKDLRPIFAYKVLPVVGYIFNDAQTALEASEYLLSAGEKAVVAIEPYADLIGFKKGSEFSEQPTEKRLETAILTIDKLVPKIDDIDNDLEKAKVLLAKINPERYPKSVFGRPVRERVEQAHDQAMGLLSLATDAKPLLKKLPFLLGKDAERKYLIWFVNDAELRPTGGFLTAYSIFTIDKGQLRVKESSDIYDLDSTIPHPAAPDEITRYHKDVSRFYIRDSNLSPDFPASIEIFEGLLAKGTRRLDYDGVISIDTNVLVKVLEVLGPTEASGVTFKADIDERCDCPQVFYELEDIITRPTPYFREQRKSVLSTLLFNIMQKSLGVSPSQYWGRLVQVFLAQLDEKHILINMDDKASQKAIESLGYGGRVKEFDSDYLHINNTNFAGAKSNMFTTNKLSSKTETKGDKLYREVVMEYRNTHKASDCNLERGGLCLNAPLRNWVRVYVPQGAKLVKFTGSEKTVRTYNELGKTVFEGFLRVNPIGKAEITIMYELPKNIAKGKKYQLLIQKQPGTKNIETTVLYNGLKQTSTLPKDVVFSF